MVLTFDRLVDRLFGTLFEQVCALLEAFLKIGLNFDSFCSVVSLLATEDSQLSNIGYCLLFSLLMEPRLRFYQNLDYLAI